MVSQILNWPGPIGLGPTADAAVENLRATFSELLTARRKAGEPIPRPGVSEPLRFASSSRVNADPSLLERFIQHVLGFRPEDPVFISDESSLSDFGNEDEVQHLHGLIRSNFGVDASDVHGANIARILERISAYEANRK